MQLIRSLWAFAESYIPPHHPVSMPPVPGGKAPTPHKGSCCLLLHPSFLECYAPETCPESHTPLTPAAPTIPLACPRPLLPSLSAPLGPAPSCTTSEEECWGGSKQHGQAVPQEQKTIILRTGNLSYRPLCMSTSELRVPNTDTSICKQISEEGCRFKVSLK